MKTVLSLTLLLLAACASDEQTYCENVGDCSQKGDTNWIASCQTATDALRDEASASGCGNQLDAYYACTSSNFTCNGITSEFPGCDRSALDACIAAAQAGTSCAELQAKTSACAAPDAGPTTCTASSDCQARCYLDHVANACAPRPDELSAVTSCGATCPQ